MAKATTETGGGLSDAQRRLLLYLYEHGGEASRYALDALVRSRYGAAGVVGALCRRGLVREVTNPYDRLRSFERVWALTKPGREEAERLRAAAKAAGTGRAAGTGSR